MKIVTTTNKTTMNCDNDKQQAIRRIYVSGFQLRFKPIQISFISMSCILWLVPKDFDLNLVLYFSLILFFRIFYLYLLLLRLNYEQRISQSFRQSIKQLLERAYSMHNGAVPCKLVYKICNFCVRIESTFAHSMFEHHVCFFMLGMSIDLCKQH